MTYLRQQGLSEQDIENTDFPTLATLQGLRSAFRIKYPSLITNITRLLLEKGEEALACQAAAYYELALDDDLLLYVIERKQFNFLKFVWAFGKNCLGQRFDYIESEP